MSPKETEQIRRELGWHLAEAGRKAGVTTAPAPRAPEQPDICDYDVDDSMFLYFTDFEQFEAWCDPQPGAA
jgi:hypothetical protein